MDADDSSLQADSQSMSVGLVWGRRKPDAVSAFIK